MLAGRCERMLVVVVAKEILIWLAQNGVIPSSTQERPTPTGRDGRNFITIANVPKLIFPHIHRASYNYWGRHYHTFNYKSPPALTFTSVGTRPNQLLLLR